MLFGDWSDRQSTHRESIPQPAFYRMADLLRITALSRATLYRRIADGRFPPPVHLGGRACGWSPGALQAWIDDPQGYAAPRCGAPCSVRCGSGNTGRTASDAYSDFGHDSDTTDDDASKRKKHPDLSI
ncbi:MAG: AlpA family phage regulatory protein [Pseudacidovorax sp.]|uniref:helix-turn-helix transcriptional regulator n=1 Tax=Pseudacidovorax sp. TaxID=1934311 RepID=UPI001B59FCD2|nr:AlpA family phage regulatory protein [Pseudacidovorax sp.]